MADLKVKIHQLELKNPVTVASGTFGFGEEMSDFFDLGLLGGIFVKGLTAKNREGNDYPRMAETPSGMLNSVGLQNKGIDYFINSIYPNIKDFDTDIIANVNGGTIEEYIEVTEKLNDLEKVTVSRGPWSGSEGRPGPGPGRRRWRSASGFEREAAKDRGGHGPRHEAANGGLSQGRGMGDARGRGPGHRPVGGGMPVRAATAEAPRP